jgi:hypothetical protein
MLHYVFSRTFVFFLLLIGLAEVALKANPHQAPMMVLQMEESATDIVLWDTAQALTIPVSTSVNHEFQPVWSPDGNLIAYLRWDRNLRSASNFVPNLYLSRADGTGFQQILSTGGLWASGTEFLRGAIRWSPDSSRLALYYVAEGRMYLHVIRSDCEEILRRTLTMDKEDFLIWS